MGGKKYLLAHLHHAKMKLRLMSIVNFIITGQPLVNYFEFNRKYRMDKNAVDQYISCLWIFKGA
jgi:hypothetical protein